MLKGIFFDFDGVLFDSEKIHHFENCAFMESEGFSYEEQWLIELVGTDPKKNVWHDIYEHVAPPYSYEELIIRRDAFLDSRGRFNDVAHSLFPGVKEGLLKAKEQGIKLAVASSSPFSYLEENTKKAGIYSCFDCMYSGRDLKNPKPAPDIYLNCASALGLKNSECAVVEDSYYGILAGKRAGMKVVAVRDDYFGMDQSQADVIVDTTAEAIAYLLSSF
ncbi:MAG: HAD family phosphatase [Erysipelotrichaceae bacterium]|nr:HAD family phosphatase [Erysipelotrichaceae bacterium]